MKRIFCSIIFLLYCPVAFALDCSDDEKLIPITSDKIGYDMYNESLTPNDITDINGTEWRLRNKNSHDQNVIGQAICLNTEEFYNKDKIAGPYCHCQIKQIDNYKVLSDWVSIKHYQNHSFDDTDIDYSEPKTIMQAHIINDKNKYDCMRNCPRACQDNLHKIIKTLRGFYVCDKALFKTSNKICVIDKNLVTAEKILIFDTIAELNIGDTSIFFTKGTDTATYVGDFNFEPLLLKIQNNNIYLGRTTYAMEECL